MYHYTELSFVDEFRWVSPLHYLKNRWENAVLLWCMLQMGPPSLHYYCAVVLHSCVVHPAVGHFSNQDYHCCRQSSCVSNFYRTFKVFIWLSLVKTNKLHQCIEFILFWNDILHVSEGLSVHHQEFKTVHTATGICQTDTAVCLHLSNRYCCLLASKQSAVSVSQMPVAVCTVLSPWWWTERPSETCRV